MESKEHIYIRTHSIPEALFHSIVLWYYALMLVFSGVASGNGQVNAEVSYQFSEYMVWCEIIDGFTIKRKKKKVS